MKLIAQRLLTVTQLCIIAYAPIEFGRKFHIIFFYYSCLRFIFPDPTCAFPGEWLLPRCLGLQPTFSRWVCPVGSLFRDSVERMGILKMLRTFKHFRSSTSTVSREVSIQRTFRDDCFLESGMEFFAMPDSDDQRLVYEQWYIFDMLLSTTSYWCCEVTSCQFQWLCHKNRFLVDYDVFLFCNCSFGSSRFPIGYYRLELDGMECF